MIFYLLRHGVSESNDKNVYAARKIDLPLTNLGIQQGKAQAKVLEDIGFEKIYTSPLLRAKQTADIVGRSCGLAPVISVHLREIDVGILDGKSMLDPHYSEIWENTIQKWEKGDEKAGFPDGETLVDIETRFTDFLEEIDETERPILLVSHCGFFMVIIWAFCENHGPTFEDVHMGRGCYSIISGNASKFNLVEFNISPIRD